MRRNRWSATSLPFLGRSITGRSPSHILCPGVDGGCRDHVPQHCGCSLIPSQGYFSRVGVSATQGNSTIPKYLHVTEALVTDPHADLFSLMPTLLTLGWLCANCLAQSRAAHLSKPAKDHLSAHSAHIYTGSQLTGTSLLAWLGQA